ncbi:MAG: retroviral-like aspartic protease, partial [Gammaproteobacteria bacterium]|nr:retroviral-like aspartic protease [Gammaproteobacteria bacterium]
MTSIKAMAEEMLGYLKPQAPAKQVTNVQAVEPSRPPPIPRDRKLCDYCGRTGHDKSTCFLDPAGEYYKPEYAKFVNDRSKKEKKNYDNILRKKASKQQCNDSSETSEEESDEDDHKAKKTNRTKQKVNFANMILQSMAKEVRSSKSHSGSKGKGPSDAMLAMGLLGTTIKNAVMKLLPGSDKVVTNLAVESQRDDEVVRQRKALAERVIPPQFNCVPHKVSDRTLPRRKVLPKVAPHIQDSAKAWRELRKMSQMAVARRNDDKTGSDSGFQSVESDEEPLQALNISAEGEEARIWSSRQQEFRHETTSEERSVFQCLFEPVDNEQERHHPIYPPAADKELEFNLLCLDEDMAVKTPECEMNFLVDERNRVNNVLKTVAMDEEPEDNFAEASRICVENTRLMERQFEGLTGENGELGEDPANAEIYALSKEERCPNDPVQALAHAEDVVPDPATERPDDLPVVLVVIDGEPGEMLVDSGSQVNGISQEFYDKIARGNNSQLQIIPDELCKIRALGHTFLSKSAVEAVLTVGKNTRVKVKFKVLPGLPYAAVL